MSKSKKIIVPENLLNILEWMLEELENNKLRVVLAGNGNNKARVVDSKNTEWYINFCEMFSSNRKNKRNKHDTIIKREETIRILKFMIDKKCSWSKYADELLEIARELKNDFDYESYDEESTYCNIEEFY